MSGWLVILLVVCGFAVGVHFGVNVLGGWRQFRQDLLEIHREDLRARAALDAWDGTDG